MWSQVYNPLQSILLSALVAAIPVIVLLGALGFFHLKAHVAALLGLAASLAIAIFEFGMPIQMSIMAAANSSGGVMGKMIDAQSIVVASTATRWYGHEGDILRFVFFHSIALAVLMGVLVTIQAYT